MTAFGRCCPLSSKCCAYGYCIDPADSCCPTGPCDPGWDCCGSYACSPPGGDCCADGNYCEAGNMCVLLGSSGRVVCCTNLQCTAAVISGTTSYLTTSTQAPDLPSITEPPATTLGGGGGITYETWYWTVTWWYLSFYWTIYQAQSTVTYTTYYETTTFTTTATDEFEASSLFSALSDSLSFTPPAEATSLASLIGVQPSETEAPSFSFGDLTTGVGGPARTRASSSSRSSTTSSVPGVSAAPNGPPGPGANAGSEMFVRWGLVGAGVVSGVLMVWL